MTAIPNSVPLLEQPMDMDGPLDRGHARRAMALNAAVLSGATESDAASLGQTVTEHLRRKRCVFLVHHVEAIDAVADVCIEMKRCADFEVIVLSIPKRFPGSNSFGGEDAVHKGLDALGIEHIRFHVQNDDDGCKLLQLLRPDFVFRQAPWDNDIQPGFAADRLHFTKVCYIPYALPIIERYMVKAELEKLNNQHNDGFLKSCWRIFCETQDSKALFDAHTEGRARLSVTGSPKFDRLTRACQAPPFWPIASSSGERPYRIIWAPHHSIGADWLGFGVFIGLVNDMINWIARDKSIEVVLKPHPALFDQLKNVGADVLTKQFLDCWKMLPNAAIVEGGDYGALFAGSDAMVTDGISFLVEYQFSGKPLVFVDSSRHVPFNTTGEKIVKGAYTVETFDALQSTIDGLRRGLPDDLAPTRQNIVNDYLRADGGSARRIIDELRTAGV